MKPLLLITPDFLPLRGGVARYLANLCNHLKDKIVVIAPPFEGFDKTDSTLPYEVKRQTLLSKWIWPRWLKVVKLLVDQQLTYEKVLVSHVLPFGSAALFAKKITKKPYMVFLHGMDVRLAIQSARKKSLAKKVLQNADLVITNSQALSQEIAKVFGVLESLVIYPCVDVNVSESVDHPAAKDSVDLITVSRLVERKGHIRVINALALLKRSQRLGHILYHIVGTGPMEKALRNLVEEIGLQSHVMFYGDVDEQTKSQLLDQSDIFVMPVVDDSVDKEGFGIVYLEAALHNSPSIATKMSGVDEAVLDGTTGILVDDGDIDQLASTIEKLVKDAGLRQQLAQAAKQRAQSEFSCQAQLSKIDQYL